MDAIIREDSIEIIKNLGEKNEEFFGKKVLLTGAAGFLGIQFVHYFAELNDSFSTNKKVYLIAIDNFSRGEPSWIEPFQGRDDIKFIKADIAEPFEVERSFDYIIHAASIASPTYYRLYPIETMDANVIGLRRLLEYAVDHPVESMLFFSTSEIYGNPTPEFIPTPETYNGNVSCTGPRACYDESKRYGETLCVNFHQVHGVPVKTARPFNNYGPGLNIEDRRVIPDFFRDVLSNQDIIMYSDGSPTRTFSYISDAITGYLLLLLSDGNGEAFNIGLDQMEISMKELAELIIRISGKPLHVVTHPSEDPDYLRDNPARRCPDITKARQLLGYNPKISLEHGLMRSHRWYLQNWESNLDA